MQPTLQDLNNSINDLKTYRNRLRSEIISISKKLRMSQVRIEAILKENKELNQLENTIKKLNTQISSYQANE